MEKLDKIQALIAGDCELPVHVARMAARDGYDVICISLCSKNRAELHKYCKKVYNFGPGEVLKILETLKQESIRQLTFIGKVSKEILFRNPKLDFIYQSKNNFINQHGNSKKNGYLLNSRYVAWYKN